MYSLLRVLARSWVLTASIALAAPTEPSVPYGSNPEAAHTFVHDGIRLYFEVYGEGPPVLVVHGNEESIRSLRFQIEALRKDHQVIAMDSRDHGRSGDSTGLATYERMTDDLAALVDHLRVGPVDVVGHSDGGIEALLLALRHPGKVRRVVAASANTYPAGIKPEALKGIRATLKGLTPEQRRTPQGRRTWRLNQMMLREPHIGRAALAKIQVPVLVTAADHDLIRDEHTIEIYHALPHAQLAVFPAAEHYIPKEDPDRFNAVVLRFLADPKP